MPTVCWWEALERAVPLRPLSHRAHCHGGNSLRSKRLRGGQRLLSLMKQEPFWLAGKHAAFPSLKRKLHVDVLVIGGGITGLTAAWLLKKAGKEGGARGTEGDRQWRDSSYVRPHHLPHGQAAHRTDPALWQGPRAGRRCGADRGDHQVGSHPLRAAARAGLPLCLTGHSGG